MTYLWHQKKKEGKQEARKSEKTKRVSMGSRCFKVIQYGNSIVLNQANSEKVVYLHRLRTSLSSRSHHVATKVCQLFQSTLRSFHQESRIHPVVGHDSMQNGGFRTCVARKVPIGSQTMPLTTVVCPLSTVSNSEVGKGQHCSHDGSKSVLSRKRSTYDHQH